MQPRQTNTAGYTHQVNFEKVFTSGVLAGRRYHDYLRFVCLADAQAFAERDGRIIKACAGSGDYRQEASIVTELE